jgi:hypothetical protein
MGDVGILISQPNTSVESAADYQYLFNSAYPSIKVEYEESVTGTLLTSGNTILPSINHGLDHPPMTIMFTSLGGIMVDFRLAYVDSTRAFSDTFNLASFSDPLNDGAPYSADQDVVFHFKCYNVPLDIEQDFELIKSPGGEFPYDPDFGMKIVKEGKDINSTDMRDFIVHTRCQSPLLLKVLTEESQTNPVPPYFDISYNNGNRGITWVFGYGKNPVDDWYRWAAMTSGSPPELNISGTTFTVNTAQAGALIILRDPLFAADDIEVTY